MKEILRTCYTICTPPNAKKGHQLFSTLFGKFIEHLRGGGLHGRGGDRGRGRPGREKKARAAGAGEEGGWSRAAAAVAGGKGDTEVGGVRGGNVWLAIGPEADREDKGADREAVRPTPNLDQSWAAFGAKSRVRTDTGPFAPASWSTSSVRSDKRGLGWSVCASPLEVPLEHLHGPPKGPIGI